MRGAFWESEQQDARFVSNKQLEFDLEAGWRLGARTIGGVTKGENPAATAASPVASRPPRANTFRREG